MKIAVFTKNRSNPAYNGARIGADRAARLLGVQVLHYVPDTPDDAQEQSRLVETALASRPDGIVFSPVHPTRVDAAVRRIAEAGIPIVSIVSPVEAVPCVCFVGSDDRRLGHEAGRFLFDALGGSGQVLRVDGHHGSFTSTRRVAGFEAARAQYPGIGLAGTVTGDYIYPTAYARTTAWLRSHPDTPLDACFVANDIMALGVIDALNEADREARVVGVNAIPEALPALQSGALLATADFNALQIAYLATEALVRYLRGEAVPSRIELPAELVTRENLDEYRKPYEARRVLTLAQIADTPMAPAGTHGH